MKILRKSFTKLDEIYKKKIKNFKIAKLRIRINSIFEGKPAVDEYSRKITLYIFSGHARALALCLKFGRRTSERGGGGGASGGIASGGVASGGTSGGASDGASGGGGVRVAFGRSGPSSTGRACCERPGERRRTERFTPGDKRGAVKST